MFTIFSPKKHPFPFGTHLKVDMHSHVLPGIDDGSPDIETSLILINGLIRNGYEKLIATPHIMSDHWPNTPATIHAALARLQKALIEKNYPIQVEAAAEYMLDENFQTLLEEGELLTMGTNYVLVETYFQHRPPNFSDLIFGLQLKGYRTILAHPERYHYFDTAFIDDLKDKGVLFQVNALSFTGYYGKKEKQHAETLLHSGLIDFIGTDVHHGYHLKALEEATVTKKVRNRLELIGNDGL